MSATITSGHPAMPKPIAALATGLATLALGVGFNGPYAALVAIYDYPDILRRPAAEALTRFAEGGATLILTWHAFALTALALVPVALALAAVRGRMWRRPGLAFSLALTGALAGVVQAIGLWRWVFVVPGLAQAHAAPDATEATRAGAEAAFDILNLYGGVAIGEHLGQWLTVGFLISLTALAWSERRRFVGVTAGLAAIAIGFGTGEGLALALGGNGAVFSLGTIAGYLLLTLTLIGEGASLLTTPTLATDRAAT